MFPTHTLSDIMQAAQDVSVEFSVLIIVHFILFVASILLGLGHSIMGDNS